MSARTPSNVASKPRDSNRSSVEEGADASGTVRTPIERRRGSQTMPGPSAISSTPQSTTPPASYSTGSRKQSPGSHGTGGSSAGPTSRGAHKSPAMSHSQSSAHHVSRTSQYGWTLRTPIAKRRPPAQHHFHSKYAASDGPRFFDGDQKSQPHTPKPTPSSSSTPKPATITESAGHTPEHRSESRSGASAHGQYSTRQEPPKRSNSSQWDEVPTTGPATSATEGGGQHGQMGKSSNTPAWLKGEYTQRGAPHHGGTATATATNPSSSGGANGGASSGVPTRGPGSPFVASGAKSSATASCEAWCKQRLEAIAATIQGGDSVPELKDIMDRLEIVRFEKHFEAVLAARKEKWAARARCRKARADLAKACRDQLRLNASLDHVDAKIERLRSYSRFIEAGWEDNQPDEPAEDTRDAAQNRDAGAGDNHEASKGDAVQAGGNDERTSREKLNARPLPTEARGSEQPRDAAATPSGGS